MELTYSNYKELKERGLKRAEIASEFGLPDWKLKKLISANGWGKQAPTIDETVFDNVDEVSAYWAGFLASDGNVDSKNRVRLMISMEDREHLDKYSDFLNSTYTIQENTYKYNRCALEFTSKHICNVLNDTYSIVPNKTNKLKPPQYLGDFNRDFIRGYFDGDGSVCESFSNKNSITATIYATLVSASDEFCSWLEEYLDSIGVTYYTQHWDSKSQIKMTTNQALTFLESIYSGSESYNRLDRKYNKFIKLRSGNRLTR